MNLQSIIKPTFAVIGCSWLIGAAAAQSTVPTGSLRVISVEEAVQLAIEGSPGLRASRLRHDSAEDLSRSVRGRFLPSIHLSDEQQHYDRPFAVEFNLDLPRAPGQPPVPPPSFVARNTNTNTFVAAVGEPLLGLLHIAEDHGSFLANAQAASEQSASLESTLRQAVQAGYLHLFEAKATFGIAQASEKQLSDQHTIMEAKLKAGVATQADLLRLEVAEANAKLQEIQAGAQAQISRATLLIALGFQTDRSDLEFAEPVALENAARSTLSELDAQNEASAHRHEVRRLIRQSEAARHDSRSKYFQLLPEIDLEAAYVHIVGQIFAPLNSEYVGVKASWAIWEWGAGYYSAQAADKNARSARLMVEDEERQVRTEVAAKLAQLRASATAVEVAQKTIASAEEAYRVTDALLKAGSATTTDLLDAQSALTQARLNWVRARYDQALASVDFKYALGS